MTNLNYHRSPPVITYCWRISSSCSILTMYFATVTEKREERACQSSVTSQQQIRLDSFKEHLSSIFLCVASNPSFAACVPQNAPVAVLKEKGRRAAGVVASLCDERTINWHGAQALYLASDEQQCPVHITCQ